MKSIMKSAAAAAIVLCFGASAHAQLLYSFESPATNPDGFAPNGSGITITQTTSGATVGTHAMQIDQAAFATFSGALTGNVPAALSSPLPVQQLQFDYTLPAAFAGGFAHLGVTIFGASQANYPGGQQFGLQVQFSDEEVLENKTPGLHTATIDLVGANNPLNGDPGGFNAIFGTGANQLIPTGFYLYINKSNTAPITVQIDNVRLVQVPEPVSLLALSGVGGLLIRRRRIV